MAMSAAAAIANGCLNDFKWCCHMNSCSASASTAMSQVRIRACSNFPLVINMEMKKKETWVCALWHASMQVPSSGHHPASVCSHSAAVAPEARQVPSCQHQLQLQVLVRSMSVMKADTGAELLERSKGAYGCSSQKATQLSRGVATVPVGLCLTVPGTYR